MVLVILLELNLNTPHIDCPHSQTHTFQDLTPTVISLLKGRLKAVSCSSFLWASKQTNKYCRIHLSFDTNKRTKQNSGNNHYVDSSLQIFFFLIPPRNIFTLSTAYNIISISSMTFTLYFATKLKWPTWLFLTLNTRSGWAYIIVLYVCTWTGDCHQHAGCATDLFSWTSPVQQTEPPLGSFPD